MRFILLGLATLLAIVAGSVSAQSLSALAKQQGCTATPVQVDGTELYKCQTQGAMSYFSGPPTGSGSAVTTKKAPFAGGKTATPASFPRVENHVQRERDDVRKRVLSEELATEVRMMVESEVAMKVGASPQRVAELHGPRLLKRASISSSVANSPRSA